MSDNYEKLELLNQSASEGASSVTSHNICSPNSNDVKELRRSTLPYFFDRAGLCDWGQFWAGEAASEWASATGRRVAIEREGNFWLKLVALKAFPDHAHFFFEHPETADHPKEWWLVFVSFDDTQIEVATPSNVAARRQLW